MEFWVVAAATGAGYVAKHWQNLSGEKDGSSKQSQPLTSPRLQQDARQVFDKIPDPVFPLPKLAKRCLLDRDVDHVSGSTSTFIEKRVDQDHTNEINGKQEYLDTSSNNRLHKFKTKNMNRKPFTSLRPLVVTGNNKDSKDHKVVLMEEKENGNGACIDDSPFLEQPIGSMKLPKRQNENFDMVLLFVGITMGILSGTFTNQKEIEHLNDLLEQAENMVKDLHSKLEIKDGFTTKKLEIEPDGTAIDSPNGEKFELTSDIEAELEAELERLEENMKSCTMQRLSNVVEIDSDFEADMARGDLNLDTVTWQLDSQSSESDPRGKTGKSSKSENTNRVFTPNYAVSSIDLQLRLHEVIESNLEARIKELESLLKNQNTQNTPRSHSPCPQEENSFWDFDHTRIESLSSTP
ncbi:hypothetical protein Lser_V15G37304 [Lactuca serriola]